jgi:hypothetical protein
MEWEELQIKHFTEWKEFEKLRTQAWEKMHDKHVEIRHVFKNNPGRIPPETTTLMKVEKDKWESEWGKDGRKRLQLIYCQQRDTERLIKQQERARRVFELTDDLQQAKDKSKSRGR